METCGDDGKGVCTEVVRLGRRVGNSRKIETEQQDANQLIFWAERKQISMEKLRHGDVRIIEYGPSIFSIWIPTTMLVWIEKAIYYFVCHPNSQDRRIKRGPDFTFIVQIVSNVRGKVLHIWRTNRNGVQVVMIPVGREEYGWRRLGKTLLHFIKKENAWKGKTGELGALGLRQAKLSSNRQCPPGEWDRTVPPSESREVAYKGRKLRLGLGGNNGETSEQREPGSDEQIREQRVMTCDQSRQEQLNLAAESSCEQSEEEEEEAMEGWPKLSDMGSDTLAEVHEVMRAYDTNSEERARPVVIHSDQIFVVAVEEAEPVLDQIPEPPLKGESRAIERDGASQEEEFAQLNGEDVNPQSLISASI
ncbi:hypothetical protein Sjap_002868 [Stephania japonica]|uniref:Uncharacterized protein n=1 Tax=Stephania japonica TaxID=461633 RepID=A0AAP0KP71_9MAGN